VDDVAELSSDPDGRRGEHRKVTASQCTLTRELCFARLVVECSEEGACAKMVEGLTRWRKALVLELSKDGACAKTLEGLTLCSKGMVLGAPANEGPTPRSH
jgi:hypothetical protein